MRTEEPDLKLAGLSLWTSGRQFPNSDDYWDGNWLNVLVRVEASQAHVEASGPILHTSELEAFAGELERLERTLSGTASLRCMEPNLGIALQGGSLGRVRATVAITPDHLTQAHQFIFDIDQSYLKPLIAGCKKILLDFPTIGPSGL